MSFKETFLKVFVQIFVGVSIVVVSAVLVGAGSIVWNNTMNFKENVETYIEASTEVFSSDVAELAQEVRYLTEEVGYLKSEIEYYKYSSNNYYSYEQPSAMMSAPEMEEPELVEEPMEEWDDMVMSAGAPMPSDEEPVIVPQQQQQIIPQEYQTMKKADILNRIQQQQQQIQQTKN